MRRVALVIAFAFGLAAPAFAQKAEIEAVNAKWMEFFNKGDFSGVASLYTEDATAFPPGSAMVGQSRNRGDVERNSGAGQRSKTHNARREGARPLRGARDRHVQPEDEGCRAAGSHQQVCRGLGEGRKRVPPAQPFTTIRHPSSYVAKTSADSQ